MALKAKSPSGGGDAPEVDMTPMIDCVFQLITFFMLVINFENVQADERVKLPDSELAKPPKVKLESELVLNMGFIRNSDGSKKDPDPFVFYNGLDLRVAQMGEHFQKEKQLYRLSNPSGNIKTSVIIRADSEVPTGVVQELIRVAQQSEYEKFVLKAMEKQEQ